MPPPPGLSTRARFLLDRADLQHASGWQEIYRDGQPPILSETAPLVPSGAPLDGEGTVLRFRTPTRLQVRGKLLNEPDFRSLAFAMLRRVLEVAWFHQPGAEIDWTFRPLLDRAAAVQVTAANLRWHDWQRYSNRQSKKIEMGGFVGTLKLAGDLEPFGPLFRAAEVLHVGKGATLGLGRVEVVAPLLTGYELDYIMPHFTGGK